MNLRDCRRRVVYRTPYTFVTIAVIEEVKANKKITTTRVTTSGRKRRRRKKGISHKHTTLFLFLLLVSFGVWLFESNFTCAQCHVLSST